MLLFREYIGEPIINLVVSYPEKKTKYPIDTIDLRHQPDHITPKKFNYFKIMPLILTTLDCLL